MTISMNWDICVNSARDFNTPSESPREMTQKNINLIFTGKLLLIVTVISLVYLNQHQQL